MSSYHPIHDTWILARAKLLNGEKYYGAYPGGFPERARALLGVTINDPVLHVCGGKARLYPYKGGFGPNDKTLDLDPELSPDFLQDAREPLPPAPCVVCGALAGDTPVDGMARTCPHCWGPGPVGPWPAILMDPPYSEQDAAHYAPGADAYPKPGALLRNALQAVRPGGRVGILHYLWPAPPPASIGFTTKSVALISVYVGFNNRGRTFSVFEREVACK